MNELIKEDLYFATVRLPRFLRKLMKEKYADRVSVGGGYLRSIVQREPINDIDIFVPDKKVADELARDLVVAHEPTRLLPEDQDKLIYRTDNALTILCYTPRLQIIHRWTFPNPQAVISSFDFTCCAAAIFYCSQSRLWRSVCHDRFYADLSARRLVYTSPQREEEPGGTMLRVLKYYAKGYRIPLDSFASVIARLFKGIDQEKISKLTSPGNREYWVSRVICELLREVDPLVDPEHVIHLPSLDQVFEEMQQESTDGKQI